VDYASVHPIEGLLRMTMSQCIQMSMSFRWKTSLMVLKYYAGTTQLSVQYAMYSVYLLQKIHISESIECMYSKYYNGAWLLLQMSEGVLCSTSGVKNMSFDCPKQDEIDCQVMRMLHRAHGSCCVGI